MGVRIGGLKQKGDWILLYSCFVLLPLDMAPDISKFLKSLSSNFTEYYRSYHL